MSQPKMVRAVGLTTLKRRAEFLRVRGGLRWSTPSLVLEAKPRDRDLVAGEEAQGSVLASDAMFPFPDGIEVGAQAGATAVVQPGGSMRDDEVIAMADKYNLAMVFTGARHFRH